MLLANSIHPHQNSLQNGGIPGVGYDSSSIPLFHPIPHFAPSVTPSPIPLSYKSRPSPSISPNQFLSRPPIHSSVSPTPLFHKISHSFYIQLKSPQKMPGELHSPSIEQLPKMPSGMQTEVAQRAGLKHVETTEKNVLPTKEDLEEERKHENFKKGIQEFGKNHQLRHVEAEEKVVLPSSQDIANEKAPKMAAEFDKSGLRHVEPVVKTSVEVIEKGEE